MMAIDREGIAKSLYGGYAEVANSPIPSVMLGYDPDAKPLPYDPDGAKELLAKSGNGALSLTLNSYNATSTIPDVQKLAETVASLWQAIGVNVTLNLADAGTILPAWRAKQLHGAGIIGGPVYFYYEPARLTLSFFSTIAAYTTVSDPELDALSDAINQETDKDKRTELGAQLIDAADREDVGQRARRRLVAGGHRQERGQLDDHQGLPVRDGRLAASEVATVAAVHPRPAGPGDPGAVGRRHRRVPAQPGVG